MSTGVCDPPLGSLAVSPRDAVKVYRWIAHCGGVAVWGCQELSDPGRMWYTPARLTDGTASSSPHWSASRTPLGIVTDHGAVEVVEHREVRRLKIAVRHGYGLGLVLTVASSKRLERALAQVGDGATYHFEGNEAVVMAEVSRTPLTIWLEAHPDAKAV
jgi:hypothetical protein